MFISFKELKSWNVLFSDINIIQLAFSNNKVSNKFPNCLQIKQDPSQ